MTATHAIHATPAAPPSPVRTPLARPPRIASVDALRALVMLTMLFVNDVAGVRGVPWWVQHFHPSTASGMTFVDLVFPAFLFLVGMSIPLALQGRLGRGEPAAKVVAHILVRGLSLLLIGVFMVNMGSVDAARMNWPGGLWQFLVFTAVLAAFHSVPLRSRFARRGSVAVRVAAFAALAYLAYAYRRRGGNPDVAGWTEMRTSWYGILGLIGWAYMTASLLYLPFRRHRNVLLVLSLGLLSVWVFDRWGAFSWNGGWIDGGRNGSLPAITLAGVALATTFAGAASIPSARARVGFAAGLAAASALGAILLHDGYGINKNAATPAWCLWSVAITTAIWIPLHALLDRKPLSARLATLITHAGANVLLAYILSSYIAYAFVLAGIEWYDRLGFTPAGGIPRSVVFAVTVLGVAATLDRFRIRLRV
jgi:predicted acyltransferase